MIVGAGAAMAPHDLDRFPSQALITVARRQSMAFLSTPGIVVFGRDEQDGIGLAHGGLQFQNAGRRIALFILIEGRNAREIEDLDGAALRRQLLGGTQSAIV